MTVPERRIKGLGEIALRVTNLDTMQKFYGDVIGLELMKRFEHSAFFRIAIGYRGHTQILALFVRSTQPSGRSTLDHLAFEIDLADLYAEKKRFEQLGLHVAMAEHEWVRWRSLYVTDPEGNRVEMVCYDDHMERS